MGHGPPPGTGTAALRWDHHKCTANASSCDTQLSAGQVTLSELCNVHRRPADQASLSIGRPFAPKGFFDDVSKTGLAAYDVAASRVSTSQPGKKTSIDPCLAKHSFWTPPFKSRPLHTGRGSRHPAGSGVSKFTLFSVEQPVRKAGMSSILPLNTGGCCPSGRRVRSISRDFTEC